MGEIAHDKMIMSNAGIIANIMWYEIKNMQKILN